MSILGRLGCQPGFLRHRPPQTLTAPCRFPGWSPSGMWEGPGKKQMPLKTYYPHFSLKWAKSLCTLANFKKQWGWKQSVLTSSVFSLCSVSGALDLRKDCETLTIALCFGGFNFLPGCSGTGLNYIWGFLMKLRGVQRVMPLQESTCQKVLWSVGALLSDSVKPLPGKQEECWAQEQGKK